MFFLKISMFLFISIFPRRHTACFFKYHAKIIWIQKTDALCDLGAGQVCRAQKLLCMFHPHIRQVFYEIHACSLFKHIAKVIRAQSHMLRHTIQRKVGIIHMCTDIFFRHGYRLSSRIHKIHPVCDDSFQEFPCYLFHGPDSAKAADKMIHILKIRQNSLRIAPKLPHDLRTCSQDLHSLPG